jgi:hypothetical protein
MDEKTRGELKARPGQFSEKVRSIFRATASNDILGFHLPNPFSGYGQIEIQKAILLAVSEKGINKHENVFNWKELLSGGDAFLSKISK